MVKRTTMFLLLMVVMAMPTFAQDQKPAPTLKSVLLEQLKSTHNNSDWFVCANVAVAGLTPEQASWTDGKGNHSVGQLANHIIFWNRLNLERMKGGQPKKFSGNNDETFNSFDAKSWNATVQQLDSVLTELEKVVENADDAQLKTIAPVIANISAHNAYHIGQIVFVRKEQGSWDASKGVK
ncbi:MAG: DinB family protein [Candidatus Acidiferrum sp.]